MVDPKDVDAAQATSEAAATPPAEAVELNVAALPEWQQRVVLEKEELGQKAHALRAFLEGPAGDEARAKSAGDPIVGLHLALLRRQYTEMTAYHATLEKRIALFPQLS